PDVGGVPWHRGGPQGARALLATFAGIVMIAGVVVSAWLTGSLKTGASTVATVKPATESPSRIIEATLKSKARGQDGPYVVYLPPGYDSSSSQRYPVLYMLHGLGADRYQWGQEGLFISADRLITEGEIQPLIIVTPEGASSYWINQANKGPRWGD